MIMMMEQDIHNLERQKYRAGLFKLPHPSKRDIILYTSTTSRHKQWHSRHKQWHSRHKQWHSRHKQWHSRHKQWHSRHKQWHSAADTQSTDPVCSTHPQLAGTNSGTVLRYTVNMILCVPGTVDP